jgi:hypothetical protein
MGVMLRRHSIRHHFHRTEVWTLIRRRSIGLLCEHCRVTTTRLPSNPSYTIPPRLASPKVIA